MSMLLNLRASAPRITLAGALLFSCGLGLSYPQVAFAQEEDAEDEEVPQDRNVLTANAYEAFRKKSWRDVTEALNKLAALSGGKIDSRLLYLKAKSFYELGKTALGAKKGGKKPKGSKASQAEDALNSAKDALKTLLDDHPDHVEGTYLYAVIEAGSGNEGEAKSRLVRAAARGRFVLLDLAGEDGQKAFKNYLQDPEFILEVMNASSAFTINVKNLRNPFASPIRPVVPDEVDPDGGVVIGPTLTQPNKQLQKLEKQIDALFEKIDQLAARQDTESMSLKFQELRALMSEYGTEGAEAAKEKLARWKQKLSKYGDLYLSIQLQIYIQQGNQLLKAMAKALEDEEWDLALQRFEQIKELRDQMREEERDVFRRNAKALFVRGQALATQAQRMKRISEFTLRITGIIIAPPDDERQRNSAIIDDRIYYERDRLLDVETDEEIPDLEVVEIQKSRVKFSFQGTEFVRALERPDAKKKDDEEEEKK